MLRFACLALIAAGCSSSPIDAAGTYTVAVTNRDNGCNLQNWTVGQSSTGITVTVTQQSSSATATVMGGGGLALDVLLGGNAFTGKISGNALDLMIQGTRPQQSGNCTYTYNGMIAATLSGDTLTGRITYAAATNGNSGCASIQGCMSYQDFNGTRPPS